MKGFITSFGYVGLINGEYQIFACEEEYIQAYREAENDGKSENNA